MLFDFAYKTGKIVYNGKAMGEENAISFALFEQYDLARDFETEKCHQVNRFFLNDGVNG